MKCVGKSEVLAESSLKLTGAERKRETSGGLGKENFERQHFRYFLNRSTAILRLEIL
jgi:hypothetical protein